MAISDACSGKGLAYAAFQSQPPSSKPPVSSKPPSLGQRIRGWLTGQDPMDERPSGVHTKESAPLPPRPIRRISDDKQLKNAMRTVADGRCDKAHEMLLSGWYTTSEAQVMLAKMILEPGIASELLKKGDLCKEAKEELEERMRNARKIVMRNVFSNPMFIHSSRVAVFMPDGAPGDPKTIILPYIMDSMMMSGKEIASFQDPALQVVSYKIDMASANGEINAANLGSLNEYFPDLILLPAVSERMYIPDLKLGADARFNPYTGELLPEESARYLMGVCFDFQVEGSLSNKRYAGMVDEMITETRRIESRPPPYPDRSPIER